jgi:hypothetical protein
MADNKRDQAIRLLTEERDGLTAAIQDLQNLSRSEGNVQGRTNVTAKTAGGTRASGTARRKTATQAVAKKRGGRPRKQAQAGGGEPEKAMHA